MSDVDPREEAEVLRPIYGDELDKEIGPDEDPAEFNDEPQEFCE